MSRLVIRKRCGRTKFIAGMSRVCRLIPNFAGGMSEDALWRLCASSRLANRRSVFHGCQLFQEKVNLFSNGVNDSSKVTTYSGKRLSTTSGKRAKTINRNQEKTDTNKKILTDSNIKMSCSSCFLHFAIMHSKKAWCGLTAHRQGKCGKHQQHAEELLLRSAK